MDVARLVRHLTMTSGRVRRAFPAGALRMIEQAVRDGESEHCAQLRFVIEGALDGAPLLSGQSARERALDLFARLHVWDTEHNNGVLVYVLLADRRVEIVADRGIHARAGADAWGVICRGMETRFAAGDFATGAVQGIEAITRLLVCHFPSHRGNRNDLPDVPLVI